MRETWVWSLCRAELLEKEMVTHSSTLLGESHGLKSLTSYIPWACKRVGHNLMTKQHTTTILVSLASRRLYVYLVDNSVDKRANFLSEARLVCVRPVFIIVVQSLSHVQLFVTSWTASCQAPLSSTISQILLKFIFIESVMLSNHLILWCSLLLLPWIFTSIRVFFSESSLCVRQPKYWSFSFRFSLSNEYSGWISFRIDWFDLLAVQGTQESSPAPQFKSINSLVLSLRYGPTLTSVHNYWKNHSFDYMDLCCQNDVWGNIKAERWLWLPATPVLSY